MKKEKDADMEQTRVTIEKALSQRFKKNPWESFKDIVGVFFLAIFLLIAFVGVIFLFVTLIENPVSFAILCVTILLIIIWGSR